VLTGPPGIGKTRLAEELATEARRDGVQVLWGRAAQERGAPPLWPWRRVLGAVGAAADDAQLIGADHDGAQSDDLAAARFRAAATAADALTAAAQSGDLLVILEDLHWADHASLFLLRELAGELPGSRLLVLATCREDAGDPWRATLGDLARLPGLQVLRPAPLDEAAVADMLAAAGVVMAPDLVALVCARAEGNPLYVTTLARVLAAQPDTRLDAAALARIAGGSAEIGHLVASLLRDLGPDTRDLLAAASVLGVEFDPGLASAVSGPGAEYDRGPASAASVLGGEAGPGLAPGVSGPGGEAGPGLAPAVSGLGGEAGPGLAPGVSGLGGEAGPGLAPAVSGLVGERAGALAAAEDRGLIGRIPGRSGSWRFSHALVRDGIYAGLGEQDRIRLHARAAGVLAALAARAPERGGEVAYHLLRAAPDRAALRRAADWAAAAATAATSALAFDDATQYLATAVDAAGRAGASEAERTELLIELATAEYRAGQLASSLDHAVAGAAGAERAGRPDLVASAALVVHGVGHPAVATTLLDLCDRALADGECPPPRRARLLAQRAAALAELGDLDAADAGSRQAMTVAVAARDPAAELDAIRARVAALQAPHYRADRLRLAARAVELAAGANQPLAAVLGHVWRIDACYQLANLEAVDTEIAWIARLAESTRLPLAHWHLLRQQASRAALTGHWALARDRSEQARRLAVRLQEPAAAGMSYAFAVWLAILRGDAGEIPGDFFDMVAASPPIPIVRAGLARALFAVGRADEARAEYETLRGLPAAGDRDSRTLGALVQLLDLIIAFRDVEMAQATYDLASPHAAEAGCVGTGVVFVAGSLHWQLGRLAALLGRTQDAVDHLATAVTLNTRLRARPYVALSRLDLAEALKASGTRQAHAQARDLARQAAAEAARLDMPGPAARAGQLMRDLDQAMAAGDPLTPREREIADLVSAGNTNRAIAGRLVLSERTVEGHVRSILAKLHLANRTELAAWALRTGDP